jgi:hypothetical protein
MYAYVSLWWLVSAYAGTPAWGPAFKGLLMSIEVSKSADGGSLQQTRKVESGRQLEVRFRNTSVVSTDFVAGGDTGVGRMYNVELTSTGPDGSTCRLLNTTVGSVGGYLGPIVIRLQPGATDSFYIDLKKLVCVANRRIVSLDKLLDTGHSVRATFVATAEANKWGRLNNGWTGKVSSGPFAIEPISK